MNNRDRVGRGLELVARGLGPFVEARMAAAVPSDQDWVQVLASRDRSRLGAQRQHSRSDARFLLWVLTEEWRAFREQLTRADQSFASELRETGDRWAHGGVFSADDTYRALDTMERLLTAVGADDQAGEIRRLRLSHQPSAAGAAPSPADRTPGRPGPQVPVGSPRAPQSWSRITRSHVIRAIEEYDRLGQDQFLTDHGFGRATAYLLIYRGRSYDSKAIAGVAHKHATGVQLGAHDFNGGKYGAARVLRRLGFEVRNLRDSADDE